MELDRYRKLTQKDVRNMYDKSLEDKHKVKQMEQQMDEVKSYSHLFKILFLLSYRKKMKNFEFMLKLKRKSLE